MTTRRRVALVLPPKEGFGSEEAGAISLIVRDLAESAEAEWEPVVIGRHLNGPPFPGVEFIQVQPPLFGALLGRSRSYAMAVARATRPLRPAIVEVHNRAELALRLARSLAPAPVLLVLHNDPQGMRGAKDVAGRRALLRSLAAVCCVSCYIRDRLVEGINDRSLLERAHVMNNGLPLETVPKPPAERAPEILFVGRVTRDKGADTFVAACAQALPRLPGWRAAMIGADRIRADSQATPFVREVTIAAERAGIAMLGFLPNDRTLARMAQCGIAAVPSRWHDPFPRVAQEAMACGAALITTERGGLPESAGDAALYVDPEDPAALAAAIERLARDPALRAELSARGQARMRHYGMAETQSRWSALRRRLLA